jgi:hypothetical protein
VRQTLKMLLDHFAHETYVERGKALLRLQASAREKLRGKGVGDEGGADRSGGDEERDREERRGRRKREQ